MTSVQSTLRFSALVSLVLTVLAAPGCGDGSGGSAEGTGGTGSSSGGASSGTGGKSSGTGGKSSGTGGSSSGSGGSNFDTGLDGSKNLNDLTPDEVEQLCEASEETVGELLDQERFCQVMGVTSAFSAESDLEGACQAARDACLAEPPEEESECTAPQDCDVTVAELEACVNDALPVYSSVFGSVPACEGLSEQTFLAWALGLVAFQQPESCAVVEERCPDVLPTVPELSL